MYDFTLICYRPNHTKMQGHEVDTISDSAISILYPNTVLECINQWCDKIIEDYVHKQDNEATQPFQITLLVNGKDLNYYESIEQHNDSHINNIISKMINIPFESRKQANQKIEQYKHQQHLNKIARQIQRNKQEQINLEQKERKLLLDLQNKYNT